MAKDVEDVEEEEDGNERCEAANPTYLGDVPR